MPMQVSNIENALSVCIGSEHTCAALADGTVWCWGSNEYGKLGQDYDEQGATHVPMQVSNIETALSVSAGAHHTCAVLADGTVWCWGDDYYGKLGQDPYDDEQGPTHVPVQVPGMNSVLSIDAGAHHTCAVLADGTVWCWGDHPTYDGEGFIHEPTQIASFDTVTSVSAGEEHACAVLADGTVWCWGDNMSGQLGQGYSSIDGTRDPVQVPGIDTAKSISVGGFTSCAVLLSGAVTCWGDSWGGPREWIGSSLFSIERPAKVAFGDTSPETSFLSQSVSSGGMHTCAVLADGTVWCWGDDYYGKLGQDPYDDEQGPTHVPMRVPGIDTATSVTAGYYHSCALLANGTVWCWGSNEYGMLGQDYDEQGATHVPMRVPGIDSVLSIDAGDYHTCALLADGTVWCWGSNEYGMLGQDYDGDISHVPMRVPGIDAVTGASLGNDYTCAVLADGTVWCWGENSYGKSGRDYEPSTTNYVPMQVSGIDNALSVSAGEYHTCAVLEDGTVWCWGDNEYGKLGHDYDEQGSTHVPMRVPGIDTATSVTAGYDHTCAVLADGTVWCWGSNEDSMLGQAYLYDEHSGEFDGIPEYDNSTHMPMQVSGINTATSVSAGTEHTCALLADGTVWCWGNNEYGKLGQDYDEQGPTHVPMQVPGIDTAIDIDTRDDHTCAVLEDGTVWCWGENEYGKLGHDYDEQGSTHVPMRVPGIDTATSVGTGDDHTCAALADGTVWCWGRFDEGNLGTDYYEDYQVKHQPTQVPGIATATGVFAGEDHTCAVLVDKTIFCWGEKDDGQLGVDYQSVESTHVPMRVPGIDTAMNICASYEFTCAVLADGTVWCWGNNDDGKLGRDEDLRHMIDRPMRVPGIDTATSVHSTYDHTCAVLTDGTVWCWGNNEYGMLGQDYDEQGATHVPMQVPGIDTATSVSVGMEHSCALLADGTVWCWGEVGEDGSTHVPVQVSGIDTATSIEAGDEHTCAVLADGTVWCWGDNMSRQLGQDYEMIFLADEGGTFRVFCGENERATGWGCESCPPGSTNAAGDMPYGAATTCLGATSSSGCVPPCGSGTPDSTSPTVEPTIPSPPPGPSAFAIMQAEYEERKEEAEEKRAAARAAAEKVLELQDAMDEQSEDFDNDIDSADVPDDAKSFMKDLAEAARRRESRTGLEARGVNAADEEDAKDKTSAITSIDRTTGTWMSVASDAPSGGIQASGRRRVLLQASTSYDVSILVPPTELDAAAVTAAIDSLTTAGVDATGGDVDVATELDQLAVSAGIDSVAITEYISLAAEYSEAKTVAEAAALEADAAEAAADEAAAALTRPPPPLNPPPPPSPPPRSLIWDDEDAARRSAVSPMLTAACAGIVALVVFA